MGTPLSTVDWMEKNKRLDELLTQEDALTVHSMNQGFEAEVVRINSHDDSYVLKIWNRSSKPDVRFQFRLLNVLYARGLSVSEPLGWGINPDGEQVLLTSFDGTPLHKVNAKIMARLAGILAGLHQIGMEEMGNLQLPRYDFIHYFFSGVGEHSDLSQALNALVEITPIKQDRIIHGDFHLMNILEDNGRYTVIDWTNGQLGDPRYDFAWALTLQKIYISERYANLFRSAYLTIIEIPPGELGAYEALACLRWMLLSRNGGAPAGPKIMEKVRSLVANHSVLKGLEFSSISTL
nr:aminoglycoside phosphotransferase family protein [Aneurinibacillus sp. XH2]